MKIKIFENSEFISNDDNIAKFFNYKALENEIYSEISELYPDLEIEIIGQSNFLPLNMFDINIYDPQVEIYLQSLDLSEDHFYYDLEDFKEFIKTIDVIDRLDIEACWFNYLKSEKITLDLECPLTQEDYISI